MFRKFVLGILLVCGSVASARVVGEYRMEVAVSGAGREPAFLYSSEDGWHCRAVGAIDFEQTGRDGDIERLVSSRVVGDGDLLQSKRVALSFRRNLTSRVAGARFVLRANCQRGEARAWVSWKCAIGDRFPEKLWHSQQVNCRPGRYSVPNDDPQSQLLLSLRHRAVTATITLANRTFVDDTRLSSLMP